MTEKSSKNIFSRIFSTIKMALNGESDYDFTSGKKLARRPDIHLKNILSYTIGDHYFFDYELAYVGKRQDVDNSGNDIQNAAYYLSNLNFRLATNKNKEYYLKFKNLFNREYEEVYGYGTGGRAFTIGARYQF